MSKTRYTNSTVLVHSEPKIELHTGLLKFKKNPYLSPPNVCHFTTTKKKKTDDEEKITEDMRRATPKYPARE